MVPLMCVLGLLPASRGSLRIKLRWLGPPLSVRVLLLSPCFCLWLILLSLRGAGSFLFCIFSHFSLNLSTDVISLEMCKQKKEYRQQGLLKPLGSDKLPWWFSTPHIGNGVSMS